MGGSPAAAAAVGASRMDTVSQSQGWARTGSWWTVPLVHHMHARPMQIGMGYCRALGDGPVWGFPGCIGMCAGRAPASKSDDSIIPMSAWPQRHISCSTHDYVTHPNLCHASQHHPPCKLLGGGLKPLPQTVGAQPCFIEGNRALLLQEASRG